MAYIYQGWIVAEPNAEFGIKRGGMWNVLLVACKICHATHTQTMIGDWHITDYCPYCEELDDGS